LTPALEKVSRRTSRKEQALALEKVAQMRAPEMRSSSALPALISYNPLNQL
jgi:hypothetical protein